MAELMTQGEWDKYRRMLKAISDAAEQDFWNIAYKLSQEQGTIGILSVPRNELIELANALVQKYGEGAAEAACQMHEEIAERSGVSIPPAEPAELPEMHEVAKVVNGAAKSGNEKTVTSAVGRMVKQVGQDTTWKNAARDGAEWAWVPAGDTCAFCITLASRGWQHASKAVLKGGHVEHIHANCDCAFAIRFGKDQKIGGYDPDKYLRMYYGAEGNTSKDRINAMRREMYEENKDQINAQKRIAYAKREDRLETFRKTKNTGDFSEYEELMSLKHVRGIVADMGLDPRNVKYRIERSKEMKGSGFQGHTSDDGKTITLYPDAFVDREQLVKTIGHENTHLKQVRKYGKVKTLEELKKREKEASDSENEWWESYVEATGYRREN